MQLRIAVLGGTRFIGRRIVDELVDAGHEVVVVHRGQSHPPGLPDVPHLHANRLALGEVRDELAAFDPEAVLDCAAFGAADAEAVLGAFPDDGVRLAVLSSMDTYRAYGALHAGGVTDAMPVDETSPVRPERFPYRGKVPGMDDYEKLEVEERWLARGGTVLRLPMVYGEHDYQRREEFVLRRVRAGRKQIPIGAGNGLLTHGYVGDVARGVRLAIESSKTSGEVFNLGETRTPTVALRARWILDAAGSDAELVRVPDDALPPDLGITGAIPQHLLVDSSKARRVLAWEPADPLDTVRRSVEWHLANPPGPAPAGEVPDADPFDADDQALARAIRDDASAATA
ncbi:MAG TPA: NAD-dependent epimerase/dehydratase family protein [Acidimicrobiales bacterium]